MQKTIKSRYPSNIALVKYWGKRGNQLPCNPSLSMTLSKAFTEVELIYTEKAKKEDEFDFYFEGKLNEPFKSRILQYIKAQDLFAPLLKAYAIRISSKNSFPHSAGIASSASAFAALAASLLKLAGNKGDSSFDRQASYMARLGSGSACRSFYGPFAVWGKLKTLPGTSDEYAVPLPEVHAHFSGMRDAILIVEEDKKKLSSSEGHRLMKNHPFAASRFKQAEEHCQQMQKVIKTGDLEQFISITEREALSLHAMMMTSVHYYWLFKPNTIKVMDKILQWREDTGRPVCFTLDAGPNIHLLYPSFAKDEVEAFIEGHLKNEINSIIFDYSGDGGVVN